MVYINKQEQRPRLHTFMATCVLLGLCMLCSPACKQVARVAEQHQADSSGFSAWENVITLQEQLDTTGQHVLRRTTTWRERGLEHRAQSHSDNTEQGLPVQAHKKRSLHFWHYLMGGFACLLLGFGIGIYLDIRYRRH